jgi:protocatechuate 3,4-dioxygenase beta subunit
MRRLAGLLFLLSAMPLRGAEITGRLVFDEKPVPGVTVSAVPFESSWDEARRELRKGAAPLPLAKAVTGANGEFRLELAASPEKPAGLIRLKAEGGGAVPRLLPGLYDASESEEVPEVSLSRAARIRGRVVDASGAPVPDAEVTLAPGSGAARETKTGADGSFAFEEANEYRNELVARKSGFAPASVKEARSGILQRPLVLTRGVALAGSVVGVDRKTPVAGALVRFEGSSSSGFSETDAEGRFTMIDVPPGRGTLVVEGGASGVREVAGVVAPAPPGQETRVVLLPAPSIEGRVLDALSRRPVSRARVHVVLGRFRAAFRTAADGRFAFPSIPPGVPVITAQALAYVPAIKALPRLSPGTKKTADLLVRESATLSGRVLDEARAGVAGAQVRAGRERSPWEGETEALSPAATRTAADGSFTLHRVPAAESTQVVAAHPDFEPVFVSVPPLQPREKRAGLLLSLRRGTLLTGTVTDEGGKPVAGVDVSVMPSYRAGSTTARAVAGPSWAWPRTTTGADGRFRLGSLAPGDYVLSAGKAGFASERRDPLTVVEGKSLEPLSITLLSSASIRGALRGKKGGPLEGRRIMAVAANPLDSSSGGTAVTRADGSFELAARPGSVYNLRLAPQFMEFVRRDVRAPAEDLELVTTGVGRVSGTVLDAGGRPVPEFRVTAGLARSGGGPMQAMPVSRDVSSEDGTFVLEDVPGGVSEVSVAARGFQPARLGGVSIEEGETRPGVDFKLSRGAALRGHVVDSASGRPVPDAQVSVDARGVPGVAADADGAFEIEGLPPGKVRVSASSPDFVPASENVEATESGASVELKLSAGGSVAGSVASPSGEPIAGAEVTLPSPGDMSWSGRQATADSSGSFRFPHVPAGRYTATARSGSRTGKSPEITVAPNEVRTDVRVTIGGSGATLMVTVTGLSAEEMARLRVGVVRGGGASARRLPDGRFELNDVEPGPVTVSASPGVFESTGRSMSREVTVPEGSGTVDVEIAFEPGLTLSVRVTRAGEPVEGALVAGMPDGRNGSTCQTDAAGTCHLEGLRPGTYRVSANLRARGLTTRREGVQVNADQTVELEFPTGLLSGKVIASGSGHPIADAQVGAQSKEGGGVYRSALTDSLGRFSLDGLPPGAVTLNASKKGYLPVTKGLTVSETNEDMTVELSRGDGLELAVRDGILGTPLSMVFVRALDASGSQVLGDMVRLDSSGRGDLASLQPGTYTLILGGQGLAPAAFDGVAVPGPAIEAALTPGGTLEIRAPEKRLSTGTRTCSVAGPRGEPLVFSSWGKRGEVYLSGPTTRLTAFPAVGGTVVCPGSPAVPFTVTEGGAARIDVP